jgi:hypothetical protein
MATITDQDRADKLAEAATNELAASLTRIGESATYSQAEYRQIAWLFDKATVRSTTGTGNEVEVTGPHGRTAKRYGYLLYAVLERAWGSLMGTEYEIGEDIAEGHTLENGGSLTW